MRHSAFLLLWLLAEPRHLTWPVSGSARPPHTPCLSSAPVFEERHLSTDIWLSRSISKEERDLAFSLDLVVLRQFTASRSSRYEGVFGWFYYCIKLTADPEQRQRIPRYLWEHLGTKQEPWSFQPHWVTHPSHQRGLYTRSARAAHPHTEAEDSITKHRAALKVYQKLCNTYIPSNTAEVSFPKAFLRTGGHSSQLLPSSTDGCNLGAPRLPAALLHTSHEEVGANLECLAAHNLWAFQLKTEQQKWSRKKCRNFCAALLIKITLQILILNHFFTVCHLTNFKEKKCSFLRRLVAQHNFAVLMSLKGPYFWAMF